jgi:hypothetical protein
VGPIDASRYGSAVPIRRFARTGTAIALAAALVLISGGPLAVAQDEAAQPAPPEPGPPQLIFSDRDLRMSRVGIIEIRVGCFGKAGQTCLGRIEARLPEPIKAPASPGGSGTRLWRPFTLGRGRIGISAGRATLLRMRLYPRGGYLVRSARTIPVSLIARFNGNLTAERTIKVYVPSR